MGGIAGLIRPARGNTDLRATVTAMTAALAHRGPDDGGIWADLAAGVALGHRRLAVVDPSAVGSQPMAPSGRYVLACDGEICNFRELRRDLEDGDVRLRGAGDTEVLLAAIEAWGLERALARAAGRFAFALFDRIARRLVLVRGRLGIKPLYWSFENGTLAFASELPPLAARADWTPRIDLDALAAYVRWNHVPAPHAIFEGVRKLRPGHVLTLDRHGRLEERAFWQLVDVVRAGAPARAARPSEPDAAAGLATVLAGTIRQHMVADVPLGVLLSGGIDSAAMVALMRAQTGRRIDSFTIGYDDPGFDEATRARAVAGHLGTIHHELRIGAKDAASAIERLPEVYDEPFGEAAQIPSVLIARFRASPGDGLPHRRRRRRALRRRALPPGGGDATLAGLAAAARLLPAGGCGAGGARQRVAGGVRPGADGNRDGPRRGDRTDRLARLLSENGAAALHRSLHSHWPSPDALVIAGAEPRRLAGQDAWSVQPASFVERQQLADLLTCVPDGLLTNLDRASMAVGLEIRVPLLDHRLVEYCWRLPHGLKCRGGVSKYLLRRLLEEHLPRGLIRRPARAFRAPIAAWLRTSLRDWAEDRLAEPRLRQEGLLDADPLRAAWRAFLGGRQGCEDALWGILMFQAWQRAFAERAALAGAANRPRPSPGLAV